MKLRSISVPMLALLALVGCSGNDGKIELESTASALTDQGNDTLFTIKLVEAREEGYLFEGVKVKVTPEDKETIDVTCKINDLNSNSKLDKGDRGQGGRGGALRPRRRSGGARGGRDLRRQVESGRGATFASQWGEELPMRTVALTIAITALLVGCTRERGDLAGVASTTSAVTPSSLNTPGGCSTKLPHVLEFEGTSAALSPDERVEVQSWASCLQRQGMDDATVVLLGPADANDETLFVRRASAIREELVTRGVERSRIVIGTPNAAREGGRLGRANAVMIEISGSTMLREMNEQR
jgi:hypothetical protein